MEEDNAVVIGRWHYTKPSLKTDGCGNTVILSKSSFAPAETCEWGVSPEKQPYELYKYCEDDFYEDSSCLKEISAEELQNQLKNVSLLFKENDHSSFAAILDEIIIRIPDYLSAGRHPDRKLCRKDVEP
ncbi:MAG: hypothetical protein J5827_03230 [Oscillospiraceae bacterium]|nr:hypothetical protein [Oscillospiraceae bacterium]